MNGDMQGLAPFATVLAASIGAVALGIRLLFRGGLVPKVQVDKLEEQHKENIKTYERIVDLYKDADQVKQRIIDSQSASVERLTEAQNTNNALIKSLSDAVEALKSQRQGVREE